MNQATWMLVDANNMVHRDYHACGAADARNILQARIQAIWTQWKPHRLVFAFDSEKSWRVNMYEEYKATRSEKPADLLELLEYAKDICVEEGCDIVSVEGFEADDVIGTLATIAKERRMKSVIFSSDKDLHQLLEKGQVTQATAVRRESGILHADWLTHDRLLEKYGVSAQQWVSFRALTGDVSDNLGGVPKIGKVTAKKFLDAGTISEFFREPFRFPLTDKQRDSVLQSGDLLDRNTTLMQLRLDVPLEIWREV